MNPQPNESRTIRMVVTCENDVTRRREHFLSVARINSVRQEAEHGLFHFCGRRDRLSGWDVAFAYHRDVTSRRRHEVRIEVLDVVPLRLRPAGAALADTRRRS